MVAHFVCCGPVLAKANIAIELLMICKSDYSSHHTFCVFNDIIF